MNLKGILSKEGSLKRLHTVISFIWHFEKGKNSSDEDHSRFCQALRVGGGCDCKGQCERFLSVLMELLNILIVVMITQKSSNLNKKKMIEKNEQRLKNMWNNTKRFYIYVIRDPEAKEKKYWGKKIFFKEILNNSKFGKKTYIQEPQVVPERINTKKSMPKHIIIKLKNKRKRNYLEIGEK